MKGRKNLEDYNELLERFDMIVSDNDEYAEAFDDLMLKMDQLMDDAHCEDEFLDMQPQCIEKSVQIVTMAVDRGNITEGQLSTLFQMMRLETERRIEGQMMFTEEEADSDMFNKQPDHI